MGPPAKWPELERQRLTIDACTYTPHPDVDAEKSSLAAVFVAAVALFVGPDKPALLGLEIGRGALILGRSSLLKGRACGVYGASPPLVR